MSQRPPAEPSSPSMRQPSPSLGSAVGSSANGGHSEVATAGSSEEVGGTSSLTCAWGSCSESFQALVDLVRHINERHVSPMMPPFVCEWRGCIRENAPLPTRFSIIAHMRRHTMERPFECEKCKRSFSRSDALNKHVKTQHINTPPSAAASSTTNSKGSTKKAEKAALLRQKNSKETTIYLTPLPDTSRSVPSRLRRYLEHLESEKASMVAEMYDVNAKIRRLRTEKTLLLDELLNMTADSSSIASPTTLTRTKCTITSPPKDVSTLKHQLLRGSADSQ